MTLHGRYYFALHDFKEYYFALLMTSWKVLLRSHDFARRYYFALLMTIWKELRLPPRLQQAGLGLEESSSR